MEKLFSIEGDVCATTQGAQSPALTSQDMAASSLRTGTRASAKQLQRALKYLSLNPLRGADPEFQAFLKKADQMGEESLSENEKENVFFLYQREKKLKKHASDCVLLEIPMEPQPWLFPEAARAHQLFCSENMILVQSMVNLMLTTIRLAEDIAQPSLPGAELQLFPLSFVNGGQFEMWFTEHELIMSTKPRDGHVGHGHAAGPRFRRTSSQSEDDNDFLREPAGGGFLDQHAEASDSHSSEASMEGNIYKSLSKNTEHSSLELSSLSDASSADSEVQSRGHDRKGKEGINHFHKGLRKPKSREGRHKKLSCRTLYEKAQVRYAQCAGSIRRRVMAYKAFRSLMVRVFALYGWSVSFESCSRPCHHVTAGKSILINKVENAWPKPETFLLCHHEKHTGSGFSTFQVSKQSQNIDLLKMIVTPSAK